MWRRRDADAGNVTPAAELKAVLNAAPNALSPWRRCVILSQSITDTNTGTHMRGSSELVPENNSINSADRNMLGMRRRRERERERKREREREINCNKSF